MPWIRRNTPDSCNEFRKLVILNASAKTTRRTGEGVILIPKAHTESRRSIKSPLCYVAFPNTLNFWCVYISSQIPEEFSH